MKLTSLTAPYIEMKLTVLEFSYSSLYSNHLDRFLIFFILLFLYTSNT